MAPRVAAAQVANQGAIPGGLPSAGRKEAEPAPETKPPVVVMPEILHFENAPYPPAAEKAGVQGSVVLKLTVDKEGNVTEATVLEPAGHGFDEAAQAAALKFKFKPATRDGVPFAVKIKYSYDFTLKVVEAPPPPPPTRGELDGKLLIEDTQTPLVGAEVVLTGPNGRELRATSDAVGAIKFPDLPPGKYKVKIQATGYDPVESEEEVVVGEAVEIKYRLAATSEGIEITVKGERPPREVTRRNLERREISRIPGTSGDALRSIQSLPGVARPPGLAGLLIVRGSSPEGTGIFIDGTDVPLIYHFGGLSSVVPTELLDEIDFYPGNFSATYGRKMGGIVDVSLRKPDTRCTGDYGKPLDKQGCFHGMAQADLIDLRAMVQGPLPMKNWSFAAAGRYSWFDTWLRPALEAAGSSVTAAPVYSDWQLIAEHHEGDSRTSLRGYGSNDRFEIIITDPAAQDPGFGGRLSFGASFFRVQALNETKLSRSVELKSMLSGGNDAVNFSLGIFKFDLDVYPFYWREELSVSATKGVKINAGLDFQVAPFDVLVRAPEPPRPGEPASGPFATRPLQETQNSGTGFRPGWYVEAELSPLERLRVVPGARVDFARDSGHADFSPRIAARYDLIKGAGADPGAGVVFERRTTLKGGVGVFDQPPEFQETDPVFGTPNLESNHSVHYSLGVEQEITRQLEVSVEAFYKDLTNQVARDPAPGGYLYNNRGTGYVEGLEALFKYKPDERFFGWAAYTLSRSIRQDCPSCDEYLFQYDQTHNFIVLGSYRLGRGWEFGARFRVVSGPLQTPVVGLPSLPAIYAADAGTFVPLQGKPFTARLPVFHQLDLRVDKRWQFKAWALSAYIDVQNVYNNPAKEDFIYSFDYSKRGYQTGVPIIPALGLRGEF
ncbi:MAG TPA: TonB-dependent receptor [Polyangiaceae bacterium]|nr:TonB-dependent receptor [Polyangiaceae bacterium]